MTPLATQWRRIGRRAAAVASATALSAVAAIVGSTPNAGAANAPARANAQVCTSWKHHRPMAAKISRKVDAVLAGHIGDVAIEVRDAYLGVDCSYRIRQHFYSASAVKPTILAALLLEAQEKHRWLNAAQRRLARAMITKSSNSAAYTLFSEVGLAGVQHFLRLAGMAETVPTPNWGITAITAHDETLLLRLLTRPGTILTTRSRDYVLYLMGHVEASERWGVRAGVPRKFSWHIKNGWSPLNTPSWWVNSIGVFLYRNQGYTVVVLTDGNATAADGITLIQRIAKVVNAGLNPGAGPVYAPAAPQPSWNIPDGALPVPPEQRTGGAR